VIKDSSKIYCMNIRFIMLTWLSGVTMMLMNSSMSLKAIENTLNAFMFTTRLIKFRLRRSTIYLKTLLQLVSQFIWSLVSMFSSKKSGTLSAWWEFTPKDEVYHQTSMSQLFSRREEAVRKCMIVLCRSISLSLTTLILPKFGANLASTLQWNAVFSIN